MTNKNFFRILSSVVIFGAVLVIFQALDFGISFRGQKGVISSSTGSSTLPVNLWVIALADVGDEGNHGVYLRQAILSAKKHHQDLTMLCLFHGSHKETENWLES